MDAQPTAEPLSPAQPDLEGANRPAPQATASEVASPASLDAMLSRAERGTIWAHGVDADDLPLLEEVARVLGDDALGKLGAFRIPPQFRLSVVMPVYNERHTIRDIVRRVQAIDIPKELIIVDDGSTDGTAEVLEVLGSHPDIRVIFHGRNQGKGAALRTGIGYARGDVVLVQDADLEYDPADYPALLEPILNGRADVVYGSRFMGQDTGDQSTWHRLGNRLLTRLSNAFTRLNLTDMETGYKVFRREVLEGLTIEQDRFGVEPELTAKIARRRCRLCEVPVSYRGRSYAEGKKIGLPDAFQALWCMVRYARASS